MTPSLSLLSRLWLSEPDADLLRESVADGFPDSSIDDLAVAFADLLLLNVYPYGSVFLDPSGELNGPYAGWMEQRYAAAGYAAPGLEHAAAADHVGLCLGFLAHLLRVGAGDRELVGNLHAWIPVLTFAVEREPGVHEFYRELAVRTRHMLLSEPGSLEKPRDSTELGLLFDPSDEVHLSDVIRFLLAPARCGFFLSRGRLARIASEVGLRVPFGSRFDVVRTLFEAAGGENAIERVIDALARETDEWGTAYRQVAEHHPAWAPCAEDWRIRLQRTREVLGGMQEIQQNPPDWEYREREGPASVFDLGDSGGSDIARQKDAMIGEAIATDRKRGRRF